MNRKGNLGLIIIIALLFALIVPAIVVSIFPLARILFQIFSIFMIYSIVRSYMGDGIITLIISGVLIWFLVFKYYYIFASLWFFQLILSLQLTTVIIWGIGIGSRR